jgi:hypothetical protein
MKLRQPSTLILSVSVLLACLALGQAHRAAAQDQPGRIQRFEERLQAGEIDAYLLKDLQAGDRLSVTMRATSGNLDPAIGVTDTASPLPETMARFLADIQRLASQGGDVASSLDALRNETFLAWDDDGGEGYASALEYVVPQRGDYALIAGSALSAFGRSTSGSYELQIGLRAPEGMSGEPGRAGEPIAEKIPGAFGLATSVEEVSGALTAAAPVASLALSEIDSGQSLTAYVEATTGNLRPILVLRDFGGKALQAGNLDGKEGKASLEYASGDGATGYVLEVQAGSLPDGTVTEGGYRVLVGLNAPAVLTGQAKPQGNAIFEAPITVQTGLKILRISEVDSPNENFTVLASLRMDWTDPALAFSPDTCNCSVKVYSDKEVDRFLAEVGSLWPAFTFFNQLGNRWTQSRAAAIWPDGRARYAESFNTKFQADFDFRQYPFDTQTFPIYLDLVYPTSMYTMTELPGFSEIDPLHGEDEFIVSELAVGQDASIRSAADQPVSRLTFSFSAPRHMNYYWLQVFLPILLIILISWFTFFLGDYTKRIEAAAANILLFIAFGWSLAGNYPRLGYVTFLDAVMAATFAVNVLVLLYNVYMRRLESQGRSQRVQRIDDVLDWLYPLLYAVLIGVVALIFF